MKIAKGIEATATLRAERSHLVPNARLLQEVILQKRHPESVERPLE